MIVAGCDVGSLTTKAVIMKDKKILSYKIILNKVKPEESSTEIMKQVLDAANLGFDDLAYFIGTGYGMNKISLVNETKSEIACHAKGAIFLMPSVRTVIDIGGQDCKVTKIDKDGKIVKFITNDKCASGTGRFLEVMASAIGVTLDEIGGLSKIAKTVTPISSMCTVWAQAEVIRMINDGLALADIGASINEGMANRVAMLVNAMGIEKDVCMTGGVAKNIGVFKSLEKKLSTKIKKPYVDSQLVGALGAAIFAEEKIKEEK
jgi:predicted CoA-substrate-specific enzyme activase